MSMKFTIAEKLTAAFAPTTLEVTDKSHLHEGHAGHREAGETHFRVQIVSAAFVGKSRLDRHRMVNDVLAELLSPGGIHALAIKAHAPGES